MIYVCDGISADELPITYAYAFDGAYVRLVPVIDPVAWLAEREGAAPVVSAVRHSANAELFSQLLGRELSVVCWRPPLLEGYTFLLGVRNGTPTGVDWVSVSLATCGGAA